MNTVRKQSSFHALPTHRALAAAVTLLVGIVPFAAAQETLTSKHASDMVAANSILELPDSPGVVSSSSSSSTDGSASSADPDEGSFGQATPAATAPKKHAPHLQMTIAPGEIADPMTVHDKIIGGMKDSVSLFSAVGWFAAAGWEQIWNDSPN